MTGMEDELSIVGIAERFPNSLAAAEYLESIRWPNGPVCPHCGESERNPYRLKHKTRSSGSASVCHSRSLTRLRRLLDEVSHGFRLRHVNRMAGFGLDNGRTGPLGHLALGRRWD